MDDAAPALHSQTGAEVQGTGHGIATGIGRRIDSQMEDGRSGRRAALLSAGGFGSASLCELTSISRRSLTRIPAFLDLLGDRAGLLALLTLVLAYLAIAGFVQASHERARIAGLQTRDCGLRSGKIQRRDHAEPAARTASCVINRAS